MHGWDGWVGWDGLDGMGLMGGESIGGWGVDCFPILHMQTPDQPLQQQGITPGFGGCSKGAGHLLNTDGIQHASLAAAEPAYPLFGHWCVLGGYVGAISDRIRSSQHWFASTWRPIAEHARSALQIISQSHNLLELRST